MRLPAWFVRSAVIGALLAFTTGCATPTPYQPVSSAHPARGGYTDRKLADDRYEVTFAGNMLTTRQRVEDYLLFRAAELTLEHGYDWFQVIDHEMDREIRREIRPDPFYRPPYGTWRPYWRYRTMGMAWMDWDPYLGDPFFTQEVEVSTLERFEATAEIRLGRGALPVADGRFLDAREIKARIGPQVQYPEDK